MDRELRGRPDRISDRDLEGGRDSNLVLHNDDVNSFDYVMETLVEICDHSPVQAEQCTMIAHYKGKCNIRTGGYTYLREMRYRLISKGLKATIE
jgi:ATP-dependent Clp protease adaptor protein ClpS